MGTIALRCGIRLFEQDFERILGSSTSQIGWKERPVLQHPDMTDVAQTMIGPVSIVGASLPPEPVVYGMRTVVVEGEDRGKVLYWVRSRADHAAADRMHYAPSETKSFVADSREEMEAIGLSEFKRVLKINLL